MDAQNNKCEHVMVNFIMDKRCDGPRVKLGLICFLFSLFPVFAQKCQVIYEHDSRTHARYVSLF